MKTKYITYAEVIKLLVVELWMHHRRFHTHSRKLDPEITTP